MKILELVEYLELYLKADAETKEMVLMILGSSQSPSESRG